MKKATPLGLSVAAPDAGQPYYPAAVLVPAAGGNVALDYPAAIPATKTKWFSGLNSIRFVLAFIVVLSHCPNPIGTALNNSKIAALHYLGVLLGISFVGVAAVVAFFIISGFVIHYPNKDGIRDIKKFYIKRLIRIIIPLLAIVLLGLFFGSPENAVVWSLYCELVYYIVYPLLTAVKISWQKKLLLAYALSVVVICTLGKHDIASLLSRTDQGYHGEFWQLGAFTWVIGLPFWLLGVNLAQRIDQLTQTVSLQKILLFRGFIIALAIIACALRFHAFVSYLVTLTLLAIPTVKWLEAEILYYKTAKPVAFLENSGKFSYSLYLCHPVLLVLLTKVLPLTIYTYFPYLLICVAGSYGFYLLLEKPSHFLAEKLAGSAKR